MPGKRLSNKMPAKSTKRQLQCKNIVGPGITLSLSLSICVYVLHWDDEKRLPAVRLRTSLIRNRSYITWPGK